MTTARGLPPAYRQARNLRPGYQIRSRDAWVTIADATTTPAWWTLLRFVDGTRARVYADVEVMSRRPAGGGP
jgi:hypothetical protein